MERYRIRHDICPYCGRPFVFGFLAHILKCGQAAQQKLDREYEREQAKKRDPRTVILR